MKLTKQATITLIVLSVIAILGLWLMGNYNSLVQSRNDVDKTWGKVETRYQRRLDLIDNLVASTKGAQGQEKEVFIKIAEARSGFKNASSSGEQAAAASQMETNIALIPRLQEAYPDLKSNNQVQALMNELGSTENDIMTARDSYNDTTSNYNLGIQRFPKSIFASMFGFTKQNLFKADVGAKNAPKVQF
jgi:LemA protein